MIVWLVSSLCVGIWPSRRWLPSAPSDGSFSPEVLWPGYDIAPGLHRARCYDILDLRYGLDPITRAHESELKNENYMYARKRQHWASR